MTVLDKPQAPDVRVEMVPQELKELRRWVAWRYQFEKGMWKEVAINVSRL